MELYGRVDGNEVYKITTETFLKALKENKILNIHFIKDDEDCHDTFLEVYELIENDTVKYVIIEA